MFTIMGATLGAIYLAWMMYCKIMEAMGQKDGIIHGRINDHEQRLSRMEGKLDHDKD